MNPKVNTFWYKAIGNYIIGFTDNLWDVHHNYGHHSYTGIYRKDPDVSNAVAFLRKTEHQTHRVPHKYQQIVSYFLLSFMPGQWFGQLIIYTTSLFKKKIFGLPLIHKRETRLTPTMLYYALLITIAIILGTLHSIRFSLLSLPMFAFGFGFVYWATVFPNHDTEGSEILSIEEMKRKEIDWGEHQIRTSGNFKAPNFFTFLVGGMNFQIEHHLFPSVHQRHYAAISEIVQDECEKRGVPYNQHSSWLEALKSNFRHVVKMSKAKVE